MVKPGGIFVAAGSNLGDRSAHILDGLRGLTLEGDVRVLQRSTLRETEAVGGPPGQGPYLNAVAELATELAPEALLARLQAIEAAHGRVRAVADGPRTLDLDLLLYRDLVLDTPTLRLPHPRMWARDFVMTPLREICPEPRLGRIRARLDAAARKILPAGHASGGNLAPQNDNRTCGAEQTMDEGAAC